MADIDDIPLTTRARLALGIARGIAASRGDHDITPIHVALGLIREGQNPAVAALQLGGVDLLAIRRTLEAALGPASAPRAGVVAAPRSPGEERMIEMANVESRRMNQDFIAPHHLLLAIVRDTGSATARALAAQGFTLETAADHLTTILELRDESPRQHVDPPSLRIVRH